MMNSSDECSSGCESGWTLYLEHSFLHGKQQKQIDDNNHYSQETDEDLSMVSDASSGPPLYSHEEEGYFNGLQDDNHHYSQEGTVTASTSTSTGGGKSKKTQMKKKTKKKVVEEQRQIHPMGVCNFLDDTASSPAFNNTSIPHSMDYSQAFSATHFQKRGSGEYDDQFGYVQPSLSGNYPQNHQLSVGYSASLVSLLC
ncbi:Protein SOB FIVE-LIKE 5 [Linum grandiflorum]